MTREEILRMAESVGFYLVDFIDDDKSVTEQIQADNSESLYSFAALVAAAEREACAKVCEEATLKNWFAEDCVALIRERNNL
jgi:hypothetical protein